MFSENGGHAAGGMRRGLPAAALAGLFAGLAVAMRELLIIITWGHLRRLASLLRESSFVVLACVAIGLVIGIMLALLLPLLRRFTARFTAGQTLPWTAMGLGLLAAVALGVRALTASDVANIWLDITVVALALLALSPQEGEGHETTRWTVRAGLGLLTVTVVFFGGNTLVNDINPIALRAVGYLVLAPAAAALGFALYRWSGRPVASVAVRWGSGGLVATIGVAVIVPALVLMAWHYREQTTKLERKINAMPAHPAQAPDRPNIILISVDTLRGDAPGYAGGAARTPTMDALASESFVFTRAYSVAPWTRPSFASFFSSLYPSEMGVARIRGFEAHGAEIIPFRWREEPQTLTEVLHDAGYRTAAVITNGQLVHEAAADQGFDFFYNCKLDAAPELPTLGLSLLLRPPRDRYDYERADYVAKIAKRVIPRITDRPLLLWLHYMDPHYPYDPPGLAPAHQVHDDKADVIARLAVRSGPEMQRFIDAYRAEVEFCDRWLNSVVRTLQQSGLWEDSIIVFWSDHGEEFWEHGSWEHSHTLFNELLHVPLLIHLPGQSDQRVITAPVSLLDVMPTLLDLVECAGPQMRGRSLAPLLTEGGRVPAEFRIFLEVCAWGTIRKGLMTERYKLIYDVYHDRFSLYDLLKDPGELHDIWGTARAPDTTDLERELLDWTDRSLSTMASYEQTTRGHLSPEVRRQLRDMGYIQ